MRRAHDHFCLEKMSTNLRRIFASQLTNSSRYSASVVCRSAMKSHLHRFCSQASTASSPKKAPKTVNVTFIDRDGDKTTVEAKLGDSLLDVAKDNDVDLEGACEQTLSCSTCHLVFDEEEMKKLSLGEPSDEELDMLDLAYGLTDTSRLGCQITVTEAFEGITLAVPKAHRDVRDL